jgi:diguanylate cyclase (GGDEF)-like protein
MLKAGWAFALGCALMLGGGERVAAQQDASGQIDAIYAASEKDNAAALVRLRALGQSFDSQTAYAARRDYLVVRTTLEVDAGDAAGAALSVSSLKQLAQSQRDGTGAALATTLEGELLMLEGKSNLALLKLTELEPAALRAGDAQVLWRLYFYLGKAQLALGRFEPALASSLKCLQFADQQKRLPGLARLRSLNRLLNVYIVMKNWDKALEFTDQALVLAQQLDSRKMLATLNLNQGLIYISMGRTAESQAANQRALVISRESALVGTEATVLLNMGDGFLRQHDYARAQSLSLQALEKFVQTGETDGQASAYCNIGYALMGQGKISAGVAQVRAGMALSHAAGAIADEEAMLAELGSMYEKAGMYREAVATIREQQKLSDQLFGVERERSVAALQEQFGAVQRQKQIELLEGENTLKDSEIRNQRLRQTVTLLGAVVVLMAGGFIFLLYRRVRKANRELVEVNQQLEFHSVRDPLTGLYNRRSFIEMMKRRPTASAGDRREDLLEFPDGLLILDIDHFKPINDSMGHAAGDAVLVEVARRLRLTVRDSDMVMRWGGEEFLVFSPKATIEHLKGLAERLLSAFAQTPIVVGSHAIPVTLTGGFVSLPFSGLSEAQCNWEKALQIADMALYLGKVHGRNRAYGLVRLLVAAEQAMPVLERDLSTALQAQMVELVEVIGPAPASKMLLKM